MLLAGVFVVAALSLSEVAISCLVRVPRIGNVAMILIDKFHVQEDAMLVSLSLWLVGAAIPGAVLAAVSARRWR